MAAPPPQQQQQQQQQQPQRPKINKMQFQTIYPQYIDASITPTLGRRLTATQGVEKPTLEEMFHALKQMGFDQVFVDPTKSLPCSQAQAYCIPPARGCIKVGIKELAETAEKDNNRDRKSINSQFKNKNQVMKEMANTIKNIDGRKALEMTPHQMQAKQIAEDASKELAKSAKSKPMNLAGAGGGGKQKVKVVRR